MAGFQSTAFWADRTMGTANLRKRLRRIFDRSATMIVYRRDYAKRYDICNPEIRESIDEGEHHEPEPWNRRPSIREHQA